MFNYLLFHPSKISTIGTTEQNAMHVGNLALSRFKMAVKKLNESHEGTRVGLGGAINTIDPEDTVKGNLREE